jgi:hypothetical protein
MPFYASVIADLETAVCDGFEYHRAMDEFIIRAGVPREQLLAVRLRADEEARKLARAWAKVPKRYVVQILLTELCGQTEVGERLIANLITATLKHNFINAGPSVRNAVSHLKERIATDRQERRDRDLERNENFEREQAERMREKERSYLSMVKSQELFRERFLSLIQEQNAQQRGYLLEIFLNDFLEFEGLEPRASFKIVGEQIDGSFSWQNRTFLTEAKWVKDPVSGGEFGAFIYKLGGKTEDTQGLFVSINGYSPEAIVGLKGKGALRFVCIDGAHIVRALSVGQTFPSLLEQIWRHADETGEAYLPIVRMAW